MKNTITIPATTLTVGEIIDKYWHLLSKTSQERSVGAALAALNLAAQHSALNARIDRVDDPVDELRDRD